MFAPKQQILILCKETKLYLKQQREYFAKEHLGLSANQEKKVPLINFKQIIMQCFVSITLAFLVLEPKRTQDKWPELRTKHSPEKEMHIC